jgi:hypothetical protein
MKDNLWWVELIDETTGIVKNRPVFLVRAVGHEDAVKLIEDNLDRDEYPATWKLVPQIVEFGDGAMGPDVAYL